MKIFAAKIPNLLERSFVILAQDAVVLGPPQFVWFGARWFVGGRCM
ncbi:MAG: hypothetical protein ACO1TE_11970 [Prosthecobacter sp.]